MTASYVIAGMSKLTAAAWRRGDALHQVLRSSCYGNPVLAAHISGRVAYCLGLGVALFEVLFLLIWVSDYHIALALIALGLLFHFTTWLIMGLNSCLIAFAAGYPALVWLVLAGRNPFGMP